MSEFDRNNNSKITARKLTQIFTTKMMHSVTLCENEPAPNFHRLRKHRAFLQEYSSKKGKQDQGNQGNKTEMVVRHVPYVDVEKESRAKMKGYLRHGYNINKEMDHLNFIKKYLGYKSNDVMDDRFMKLQKDGLRGMPGITEQDELLALEKEEELYFADKIKKNPTFLVEMDPSDLAKSHQFKQQVNEMENEIEK